MVAEMGLETGGAKPRPAPTNVQIIRMMRALVMRRLEQMTENPMADGTEEQKLLEIISRTTTKLEDFDKARKAEAQRAPRRSSKAVTELRRQIADRIDQLNQG